MSDNADTPTNPEQPEGAKEDAGSDAKSNLIFAVGFVATLATGYYVGQEVRHYMADPVELVSGDRYKVDLRGDEPQKGPDDALVTIIAFSDFQCPWCAKATGPLDSAMAHYGDDVRLIFKHYPLPFHQKAIPAAKTAWAAQQQDAFWPMHDWLFEQGGDIQGLPAKIKEMGLDGEKFGNDMESAEATAAVDQDSSAGGKVGVSGTPAFVVNGHLYGGGRGEEAWRQIIEAELAEAKVLMDAGTARGEVYEALMAEAKQLRGGGGAVGGKPSERATRRPGEPDPALRYKVGADNRPQKGAEHPTVTIVEFADYHCPFCVKVKPTLDNLLKTNDDLALVYRQRPLNIHPRARAASKAALAAGRQGKFWEMHDKIFIRKAKDDYQFIKFAEELGLDVEKFKADMEDPSVEAEIAADEALAEQFGTRGTPAFFINGRFLSGNRPIADFEKVIQEEREHAKANFSAVEGNLLSAILADAETEVRD